MNKYSSILMSAVTLCVVPFTGAIAADSPAHGGTCCKAKDMNFEVTSKRMKGDDVEFSIWTKDNSGKAIEDGAVSLEIELDKAKKTEYISSYNGKDGAWHTVGIVPKHGQKYNITVDYAKKGEKSPSIQSKLSMTI